MIEFTVRVDTKSGGNPTVAISGSKYPIGGIASWLDKKKRIVGVTIQVAEELKEGK